MGKYLGNSTVRAMEIVLMHVLLLRERGDNQEADAIMSELADAFAECQPVKQEAP